MSVPYFPMYPADFEADTSHLTLEEDGAYNRLLRLCWMTPGCSLPDDPAWIARRMRVSLADFQRVVAPLLDEFFKRAKGRVFSPRLTREWEKVDETSKKRSEAGKKGGRPKAIEKQEKEEKAGFDFDKAGPKQPEPEPYREDSVAKATDGQAVVIDFAHAIFTNGVKFLCSHGVKETAARSVIGKWRKEHPDPEIFDAFAACAKSGAIDPIPWITARLTPRFTPQFDPTKFEGTA